MPGLAPQLAPAGALPCRGDEPNLARVLVPFSNLLSWVRGGGATWAVCAREQPVWSPLHAHGCPSFRAPMIAACCAAARLRLRFVEAWCGAPHASTSTSTSTGPISTTCRFHIKSLSPSAGHPSVKLPLFSSSGHRRGLLHGHPQRLWGQRAAPAGRRQHRHGCGRGMPCQWKAGRAPAQAAQHARGHGFCFVCRKPLHAPRTDRTAVSPMLIAAS